MKRIFGNCKKNYIHFFGSGYQIVIFHWIKKLSKYNIITQHPSAPSGTYPKIDKTIKSKIRNLITKIFLQIDTEILIDSGRWAFELKPSFYEKNKIFIKPYKEPNRACLRPIKEKILKEFKSNSYLLILEDLVPLDRTNSKHITKVTNQVITKIGTINCIVKPHPRLKKLYGISRETKQIPNYIPSEFLTSDTWKAVIGVESQSLIEFSKYTTTISLLNLYTYKDRHVQENLISWLKTMSNNRIKFPKTINELEKLL